MDGVKVALDNSGMTVEAARCARDRNEWRALVQLRMIDFTWPFLRVPVFFWTVLPRSGAYTPREELDAVT